MHFKIICTCIKTLAAKQRIKMKSYCLTCRKYTENIDLKVSGSSNDRVTILSKCAIFEDLLKIKKQNDY